ncbi:MAG: hypothetical protein KatS3mg110_2340 [Pirellulaceae bacterium]|nr:MAG: hypothetical protein KatS3mg110_2340 [Pirellulaceae bacterium]
MNRRLIVQLVLVAVVWLGIATAVWACPTCKQAIAEGGNAEGLVRGYYYSILFMMSMPFLILGGLGAYFYWEVRRARSRPSVAASSLGGVVRQGR